MNLRSFSEKSRQDKVGRATRASLPIILCLHALLWSSIYVVGSTAYVIATEATDLDSLPAAILAIVTASVSIIYIGLHNATTYLTTAGRATSKSSLKATSIRSATLVLRLMLILWLVSSGFSVTFTIARHPFCARPLTYSPSNIAIETTCIVQHTTVALSLLAMLVAGILFVLMHKVQDPFRCHLFGTLAEEHLLPFILPYQKSLQNPMFSEMSFKCRASTSTSSHTLVPSFSDSTTALECPEKSVGLGIYAPKTSATFLAPRPSLFSIRSHATMRTKPPQSPLSPLPAFFPETYRQGSAMHRAVYPPRAPTRLERSKSGRTVRIVPPSPVLSMANLEAHNRSVESLSSVYSRSISGERRSSDACSRPDIMEGSRSFSSGSTATVKRSPLGAMRLAEHPDVIVIPEERPRVSSESSDSDNDDAQMLQALPSVKAVSEFGDVQLWASSDQSSTVHGSSTQLGSANTVCKQRGTRPLTIRKTRDSAPLFQSRIVQTAA